MPRHRRLHRQNAGAASYARYAKKVDRFLKDVGGTVTYMGKMNELLIGHETWDAIILVQYPSRKAYLKMVNDPDYLKIHKYRAAAIDRSVLYAIDEMDAQELFFGAKS